MKRFHNSLMKEIPLNLIGVPTIHSHASYVPSLGGLGVSGYEGTRNMQASALYMSPKQPVFHQTLRTQTCWKPYRTRINP